MSDSQTDAYNAALANIDGPAEGTPEYAMQPQLDPMEEISLGISSAPSTPEEAMGIGGPQQYTNKQRNSLLGGGYASAKGNFWKGLGTTIGIGEDLMGFETEVDDKMLEWSKQNSNDALVNTEGLIEDVIYTSGQLALPIGATVAAATLAPFIGISAVAGAGIAGMATAWGMTAGDFFTKEQNEDPDYEPGLADVGITALLAAPEAIPIAKGLKILKPFADAVGETAVKTAQKAGANIDNVQSALPQYTKGVATTAVQQGVLEGGQDFAGSIAAALQTGSELDIGRVETMARGAAYEGLVAGILGVPLGGLSVSTERAIERQQNYDKAYEGIEAVPISDAEGNLSFEFKGLAPVSGAPKNPGMFTTAVQTLVGNSTSKLKTKFAHMPKAMAVLNNFHLKYGERGPGMTTFNEDSRAIEGELQSLAKVFNKGTKQQRKDAWDAKANGIKLDDPVSEALWEILNTKIPELTKKFSKDQIKTEDGLMARDDYLPTNRDLSMDKLIKDPDWRQKAVKDMVDNGKGNKEIENTMEILENYEKSYKDTGDHLSYSKDKKSDAYREKMFRALAKKKGKFKNKKDRNKFKSQILREAQQDTKQSPLTLDRSLGNLSQNWHNAYRKSDDPRSALNQHIRMVSEHLSLINRLGVDNQLFDEVMIDLALDAFEAGQEFTAADVDSFYDVLRTQQRIHLKPLSSPSVRNAQNVARASANILLLGLSALVSIPEALVIVMNTGGKASLQGLVQTVLKGMDPKAAGLASEQLGYTINTAIDHGINRTGEESFEVGTWENAFIRWTGLPYLQHFLTVWAARSNDVHVKSLLTELNDGSLTEARRNYITRKLGEAGLDVERAMDWGNSTEFSEDTDYFKYEYLPSIIGLTQDTIVDPHPIDKPMWMNDERFLLLTQLKGFMTVFTDRIMMNWGRRVAASPEGNRQLATKVAPYVAMYIAAQIAMQAVREVVKKGDLEDWDEKEVGERVTGAFAYLGAMGYFIDLYNSFKWRSDPLLSVMGPVPSKVGQVGGDLVGALERSDPEAAIQSMIKNLMPNVPFKDIMLEAIGIE